MVSVYLITCLSLCHKTYVGGTPSSAGVFREPTGCSCSRTKQWFNILIGDFLIFCEPLSLSYNQTCNSVIRSRTVRPKRDLLPQRSRPQSSLLLLWLLNCPLQANLAWPYIIIRTPKCPVKRLDCYLQDQCHS